MNSGNGPATTLSAQVRSWTSTLVEIASASSKLIAEISHRIVYFGAASKRMMRFEIAGSFL
jgi:hypothetical protein